VLVKAGNTSDSIRFLLEDLSNCVVGQDLVAEHLLVALLAEGHVLLEGAPGLAKTRLARTLSQAFDGRFSRIQFTPDLLPSDLTGSAIYHQNEQRFEFRKGPLFTHFLLADEINRAPAKVQSALLEAMEERQITSGNETYALEAPFLVIATQNPIEHEGTWDLPQAQQDRFLMHLRLHYPPIEDERSILDLVLRETSAQLGNGGDAEAKTHLSEPIPLLVLRNAQREVAQVHVSGLIRDFVVRLIAGSRNDPARIDGVGEHLLHPISPRGSISLVRAAQARAWLHGRDHVLPEDVKVLAADVLRHRIGLTFRAEADLVQPDSVIAALLEQIDVV
jgi:MoxR-like ATPase